MTQKRMDARIAQAYRTDWNKPPASLFKAGWPVREFPGKGSPKPLASPAQMQGSTSIGQSGIYGGQPGAVGNGVRFHNGQESYSIGRSRSAASAPQSLMKQGGMSGQGLSDQQTDQSNEPRGIDAFGQSKAAYQSQMGTYSPEGNADSDFANWERFRNFEEGISSRKRKEDRDTMFWSMFAQTAARMFEPLPIDPGATGRMASQWR